MALTGGALPVPLVVIGAAVVDAPDAVVAAVLAGADVVSLFESLPHAVRMIAAVVATASADLVKRNTASSVQ